MSIIMTDQKRAVQARKQRQEAQSDRKYKWIMVLCGLVVLISGSVENLPL